jgi:hypothetical protein
MEENKVSDDEFKLKKEQSHDKIDKVIYQECSSNLSVGRMF